MPSQQASTSRASPNINNTEVVQNELQGVLTRIDSAPLTPFHRDAMHLSTLDATYRPFVQQNLLIVGHSSLHCCLLYQEHLSKRLDASSTPSVNHQTIPFPVLRLALCCQARKLYRGGTRAGEVPKEYAEVQGNPMRRPPSVRAPQVALHFSRFRVITTTTMSVIYCQYI